MDVSEMKLFVGCATLCVGREIAKLSSAWSENDIPGIVLRYLCETTAGNAMWVKLFNRLTNVSNKSYTRVGMSHNGCGTNFAEEIFRANPRFYAACIKWRENRLQNMRNVDLDEFGEFFNENAFANIADWWVNGGALRITDLHALWPRLLIYPCGNKRTERKLETPKGLSGKCAPKGRTDPGDCLRQAFNAIEIAQNMGVAHLIPIDGRIAWINERFVPLDEGIMLKTESMNRQNTKDVRAIVDARHDSQESNPDSDDVSADAPLSKDENSVMADGISRTDVFKRSREEKKQRTINQILIALRKQLIVEQKQQAQGLPGKISMNLWVETTGTPKSGESRRTTAMRMGFISHEGKNNRTKRWHITEKGMALIRKHESIQNSRTN